MKNEILSRVNNFNFLGLIIDNQLNWKQHVQHVANKISRTAGILSKLKYTLPSNILLMIYNSLICSHLNYCLLIWGTNTNRLFKVQKKAIRAVTHSKYVAHTDPLFKKLNLLKLPNMYEVQLCRLYYKLENNNLPQYFNNIYQNWIMRIWCGYHNWYSFQI